jgi:glycerol-3-phosphate cytidylyltransferase
MIKKQYEIGITFGSWDLLHPGHMIFLNACKERCEYLIVGLHVDPSVERPEKNKPIESLYERYIRLANLEAVNQIIPYQTEQEVVDILITNSFDKNLVRFLGSDYLPQGNAPGGGIRAKKFTGADLKIPTEYIERKHNYSSSSLHDRFKLIM